MSEFHEEDPDERRMFDDNVRAYEGRPLKAIAAGLSLMSKLHPQQGSLAKMLAIWANEIVRQDNYKQLLINKYAERKLKLPKPGIRK